MAYMSQSRKAEIAPKLKTILKKYGVKGTIAVRNGSTLVLNIKSGKLDFIGNYNKVVSERPGGFREGTPASNSMSINPYWYQEQFNGKVKSFLSETFAVMNKGNWNRSDIQTDYFDVGWYCDINIGKWNTPYVLEKESA